MFRACFSFIKDLTVILAGSFTSQLVGDSLAQKSFYVIGITSFLYFMFWLTSLLVTRRGKGRIVFDHLVLYWYGAAILCYLCAFVILPNLQESIIADSLVSTTMHYMYLIYLAFLLAKPLFIHIDQKGSLTILQTVAIGIVGVTAVWFYPNMYFNISNASGKDRANEIFIKNLNVSHGSDLCVVKRFIGDSLELTLPIILANNGDVPLYINSQFQVQLKDNTANPPLPDLVFRRIGYTPEPESFTIVYPKTFVEMSLLARVDTSRASGIERADLLLFPRSHYTVLFSCVVEAEIISMHQKLNLLCK